MVQRLRYSRIQGKIELLTVKFSKYGLHHKRKTTAATAAEREQLNFIHFLELGEFLFHLLELGEFLFKSSNSI
jgi:hypothetical protein